MDQDVMVAGQDGLNRANAMHYVRFLTLLHRRLVVDWYMEVGCRNGRAFAPARSKTIAVDPFFQIEQNVVNAKEELHIFQRTSDDFFASQFLERNDIRLSLSFLDGMHLAEYLLRDIINTERNARADGVIMLHDCAPFNLVMTRRDQSAGPPGAWTGDVWKLIPILKEYRPDLKVEVLGCKPTGLVVISNLDPDNRALSDAYDGIVAEWAPKSLAEYGADRFRDQFEFADPQRLLDDEGGFWSAIDISDTVGEAPTFVS